MSSKTGPLQVAAQFVGFGKRPKMASVVKSATKLLGAGSRDRTLHGAGGKRNLNPHARELEGQLTRE